MASGVLSLAGYLIAIWNWYRYREKELFTRLGELADEQTRKLLIARSSIYSTILRPSIESPLDHPTLSRPTLKAALRSWGWSSPIALFLEERSADYALGHAITSMKSQADVQSRERERLMGRIATAHLLRSAIDSVRGSNEPDEARKRAIMQQTLRHIDDALRLPSMENDLDAQELKAYHQVAGSEFDDAATTFERIIEIADAQPKSLARDTRCARAHKGLGIIELKLNRNKSAHECFSSANAAIGEYSHLTGHNLLDQAQILELDAKACEALNYVKVAPQKREAANSLYEALRLETAPRSWWSKIAQTYRSYTNQQAARDWLLAAANAGLVRTKKTRPETPSRQIPAIALSTTPPA